MPRNLLILFLSMACVVAWLPLTTAADGIEASLDRGARWLKNHQNPDGGYGPYGDGEESRLENASDVGITALALYALAVHPRSYQAVDGPFISKAVEFLLSKQQPDGGFYDPRDPVLQNYRTSVVLMALASLDPGEYAGAIQKGRQYVRSLQLDESKGYDPEKHLSYGTFGYGGGLRGDLSNGGFAAEALAMTGESVSSPVWKSLRVFVFRSQNAPEVSPLLKKAGIGTTGDWGFRYAPNDTRGPAESIDGQRVFSSYGSMTYQGLKTLLYAQVSRDDVRVRKAFEWISQNFTVSENPGMARPGQPRAGLQGLYYYYHTMAKALSAYGEPIIVDRAGRKHVWAKELSEKLLSLQTEDGYWVNQSDRWWENIPELDTAFAMIALSVCRDELAKQRSRESAGGAQPEEADASAPTGQR